MAMNPLQAAAMKRAMNRQGPQGAGPARPSGGPMMHPGMHPGPAAGGAKKSPLQAAAAKRMQKRGRGFPR